MLALQVNNRYLGSKELQAKVAALVEQGKLDKRKLDRRDSKINHLQAAVAEQKSSTMTSVHSTHPLR